MRRSTKLVFRPVFCEIVDRLDEGPVEDRRRRDYTKLFVPNWLSSLRHWSRVDVRMPKALTITGMAVSGLLVLLFGLDLALGFPLRKASLVMDIGFVVCALILGYLSYTTYREQV